jgi:hypothetical protein
VGDRRKKENDAKNRATKNYNMYWRLIYEGGIAPTEVFGMDDYDLYEANAALDIYTNKFNRG